MGEIRLGTRALPKRLRPWLWLGWLLAFDAEAAHAEPKAAHAEPTQTTKLGGRFGYAYFGQARSLALEHRLKPALRLDALAAIHPAWELGAALSGVLTTSSNYGVWAATALLRVTPLKYGAFALRGMLGVGLGYNAPILHADLQAGFPVIPYASLAVQPIFVLSDGFELGAELEVEQLTVIHLGVLAAYRLP